MMRLPLKYFSDLKGWSRLHHTIVCLGGQGCVEDSSLYKEGGSDGLGNSCSA